jgi:ankyrin repeat protein
MDTVIALVGNPNVIQCNLVGVTFAIRITNNHKDSLADTLLKTLEVNVPTGYNKLLQFKKHFRFRIMDNIVGNAKSFEAINEFVRFLEKYVEFDDTRHLTDASVLNDDDIHLEVMI